MTDYALDTNILSYFLKNHPAVCKRVYDEKNKGNSFVIPPTVYFETKNWLLKNQSRVKLLAFEMMYSDCYQ